VKISCKEDVHICCTNFVKKMERNLHGITSWWKTYGKRLFSEDLEARDVGVHYSGGGGLCFAGSSTFIGFVDVG
jgi:hypothetical protein